MRLAVLCSLVMCVMTDGSSNLYRNRQRGDDYDYIIVGAGSAGSVLANRLSEDKEVHVLLLEAGGLPRGISEVPFFFPNVLGTDMDWGYYSEPLENAAFGIKDQRIYLPRGKVLGGSSTINAMIYIRGSPTDYDEWARGGATGWSWDEVLPYFKKSEDLKDVPEADPDYHGTGGYLTVTTAKEATPLQEAYLDAARDRGYDVVDLNAKSNLGVSTVQLTVRDGLRCSTEKAFLRPAASRENLDILLGAHVTKVLFDKDKRAHAVRFEQNNATREVRATREIILSAGAIATPQLLMLSGVGPKEHLQEHQIPVVADLPVGQNLNDHMAVFGQLYLLNSSVTVIPSSALSPENIGLLQNGEGPLTAPIGMSAVGFFNTKYQDPSENWPDMQIFFPSSTFLPSDVAGLKQFREEYGDKNLVNVFPMLSRPKSRGSIKLRSTDPYQHPIVDLRYFSDPDDLARLVEGMKIAHDIFGSPSLQKFGATRVPKVMPGCTDFDPDSDEYLTCVVQTYTMTCYHQSGTCKMGDPKDSTTVVDPKLRVRGVKGLRVADASVMPLVTSGNTNAPCIMIGEKAADMIRQAAKEQRKR